MFRCETCSRKWRKCNSEAQWLPSALPFWELHSCGSCKCLEPWLKGKFYRFFAPNSSYYLWTLFIFSKLITFPLNSKCLTNLIMVFLSICNHFFSWLKMSIWSLLLSFFFLISLTFSFYPTCITLNYFMYYMYYYNWNQMQNLGYHFCQ